DGGHDRRPAELLGARPGAHQHEADAGEGAEQDHAPGPPGEDDRAAHQEADERGRDQHGIAGPAVHVEVAVRGRAERARDGASGLPRVGFWMHQLIMSRRRATRPSCTWNLGYVSGCVLAPSGWHMSQETPIVPPNAFASWKTRRPSCTNFSVSACQMRSSRAEKAP